MVLYSRAKVLVSFLSAFVVLSSVAFAQQRPRVVTSNEASAPQTGSSSTPTKPVVTTTNRPRPALTNPIVIAQPSPLIKKTSASAPTNSAAAASFNASMFGRRLMGAMQSRLGIRYRYGSNGPNSYDCSGLVWSVFNEAGLPMTRTSAATYWRTFEPVTGDDRFKFGTLVFFNQLGHVGIVIDENTFYHASSSKGVTFSPLAGYWSKRIVGFRRIPLNLQ